jgi:dephospho-CoA kinase
MIKIGITGNIGAGKSLVASIFHSLHWPVFNSDIEAKFILSEDKNIMEKIKSLLGVRAYLPNGALDRKYMAQILFSNPEIRTAVNQIVHPVVAEHFLKWCSQHYAFKVVCKESALLFETGLYKQLDCNILVVADDELRIQRVIKRDGINREQVMQRFDAQWEQARKRSMADFIIVNNDKKYLTKNCLEVYRAIKNLFMV